jgi:hypothetical protein
MSGSEGGVGVAARSRVPGSHSDEGISGSFQSSCLSTFPLAVGKLRAGVHSEAGGKPSPYKGHG